MSCGSVGRVIVENLQDVIYDLFVDVQFCCVTQCGRCTNTYRMFMFEFLNAAMHITNVTANLWT